MKLGNGKKRKPLAHEVVRVVTPAFLVNSAHQACRYELADGSRLTPGYYLALGPTGPWRMSYGGNERFLGPFSTRTAARFMEVSALALDIVVPPAAAPDPIAARGDAALTGFAQQPFTEKGRSYAIGNVTNDPGIMGRPFAFDGGSVGAGQD